MRSNVILLVIALAAAISCKKETPEELKRYKHPISPDRQITDTIQIKIYHY